MTEVPPQADGTSRLDRQQLVTLLGAWALAVLFPAIFAIPWAGRGAEEFQIPAYVLWGLGFVVQLALFSAIAKITRTTELWAWLVASILPWVVNLTVPDNPMYISVFVLVVGLLGAWMFLRSTAADRLLHDGVAGTGTVIEVIEPKLTGAVVNNGYVRRSVRVSVARPDKAMAYEAVLRDLFRVAALPSPGDTIALRVDPEDAMRIAAVPAPVPAPAPAPEDHPADDDPADDAD